METYTPHVMIAAFMLLGSDLNDYEIGEELLPKRMLGRTKQCVHFSTGKDCFKDET